MRNLCILIQQFINDNISVDNRKSTHQVVDSMVELWADNRYISYVENKTDTYTIRLNSKNYTKH